MGKFKVNAQEANFDEIHEVLNVAYYIANACNCTIAVETSIGSMEVKGHEKEKDEKPPESEPASRQQSR